MSPRAATPHASRELAFALADLLDRVANAKDAHERLELPGHDDEAVDWRSVLAEIDALGTATHQLTQLANERLLPVLRTLRDRATGALREIESLNQLTEALPSA